VRSAATACLAAAHHQHWAAGTPAASAAGGEHTSAGWVAAGRIGGRFRQGLSSVAASGTNASDVTVACVSCISRDAYCSCSARLDDAASSFCGRGCPLTLLPLAHAASQAASILLIAAMAAAPPAAGFAANMSTCVVPPNTQVADCCAAQRPSQLCFHTACAAQLMPSPVLSLCAAPS
jgi:hypothetical protein